MEAVECNKCKKRLVKWGSKRHICQAPKKLLSCNICERVFKTNDQVKKHVANEHKSKQDKTKIVCRHYRNGNCHKGSRCEYSHVGFVKNISKLEQNSSSTQKVSTCRHGDTCSWLARGVCAFYHRGVGVQKPNIMVYHRPSKWPTSPDHGPNRHPSRRTRMSRNAPEAPTVFTYPEVPVPMGGYFTMCSKSSRAAVGETHDSAGMMKTAKGRYASLNICPSRIFPTSQNQQDHRQGESWTKGGKRGYNA